MVRNPRVGRGSARADLGHLHFGEHLPVTLSTQVMLAPPKLDDRNLGPLSMAQHRGTDLATFQKGNPQLHVGALADQQNLTKFHRRAGLRIELLDA